MKAQSRGSSRAASAPAASGAATQRYSPLAFNCELGPDKLLFRSAHIHEELGRLYEIQVDLTSADVNIAFDSIIGTAASVRLNLTDGTPRYFHGIVSHFTLDSVEAHTAHYSATLVPWLWLLTRSADCKIFQNLTVPQIVQQVFRDHGFSDFDTRFTQTYPQWEYCVQYRETAFNFISRLLEFEGIYYYFEHTGQKHTLILCDAPSNHKAPPGYTETLYRPDGDFHATERLTDWRLEEHVQTGTYTQTDYNFQKPRTSLRGASSQPSKHRHAQFEIFDYPGEHEEPNEGSDYSKVRLQELKARRRTFRGQTSDRRLTTGSLCKVKEFPRKDFNGDYLIIAADYQLSDSDYYAGGNGSSGEEVHACSFTAIPAKRQFRPARLTPKPLIQGVQTAVVTGPKGEEVHVDDHARIKVQFHWDRYGKKDENSSCWVRVSQAWAGKGYGFISHPRIGQEVIVDFEEGDPDRPIITGRVYNAEQKGDSSNAGRDGKPGNTKPSGHPQSKMMTGMKSNSFGGSGGSNEITMNDTGGQEGLFLKAQKDEIHKVGNDREDSVGNNETRKVAVDRTRDVGNNETVTIGTNQTVNVGVNQTIAVGVNRTITVGVNEMHTINVCRLLTTLVANNDLAGIMRGIETGVIRFDMTGLAFADIVGLARCTVSGLIDYQVTGLNRTERVGSNYALKAGSNVTVKAASDHIVEAGAKAGLKAGAKIVIEAPDITLKAAGGFIRINGDGVIIKGTPKVKVNSGGAPGSLSDDDAAGGAAGKGGGNSGSGKGPAGPNAPGSDVPKSELAKFLEKLGVPEKYTKVLDQLLNDPLNMKFEDLREIAPTFEDLLKHIPANILPEKFRGIVANLLRYIQMGELAPDSDPDQAKKNDEAAKKALEDVKNELSKEGKQALEDLAKKQGLDLDKITGGKKDDGKKDDGKDGTGGGQGGNGGGSGGGSGSTGGPVLKGGNSGGSSGSPSYLNDPSSSGGTETPSAPTNAAELSDFAEAEGFTVTSTVGGTHNVGSAHYEGRAIDVRTRDKTDAEVDAFIANASRRGISVRDERTHPPGRKEWGGPHVHLQVPKQGA